MLRNPGWFRVWLVFASLVLIYFAIAGWTTKNIVEAEGSSWFCVPGSMSVGSVERSLGYIEAPESMVANKVNEIRSANRKDEGVIDEMVARDLLRKEQNKTVQVFNCASFGSFFEHLFLGMIFSLMVACTFWILRWVLEGFRRSNNV